MSADSQRLKSALRRIVLESPELRELLGDSDNRGDQAGSAGVGTSEAEESRLCCDGSISDNANPGTDERDADADSQDGLDPDDPADLASGDGTLSGVTDCATGEPICFDGSGFIPPEGWDEPNEPPLAEGYEEGVYYVDQDANPDDTGYGYNPCLAFADYLAKTDRIFVSGDNNFVSSTCDNAFYKTSPEGSSLGPFSIATSRTLCNTSYNAICDGAGTVDSWPSDGCTNLAIVNGSIVGSKYDPENDGSYSAPMDEIQLCSGTDQIGLKPAANGGWKTINAATDSGYLWDSHGRKIAHIDGNEYSDPDI